MANQGLTDEQERVIGELVRLYQSGYKGEFTYGARRIGEGPVLRFSGGQESVSTTKADLLALHSEGLIELYQHGSLISGTLKQSAFDFESKSSDAPGKAIGGTNSHTAIRKMPQGDVTKASQRPIPEQVFEDGSYAFECGFCSGSGQYPDTIYGDDIGGYCPVCDGRGLIRLRGNLEEIVLCRYCEGSGRAWENGGYFFGNQCSVCNGLGIVILNERTGVAQESQVMWELLNGEVAAVARSRYEAGHFADSVEAALKRVNARIKEIVRTKTGDELDGAGLMTTAFSVKNPIISLGDLSSESGRNIQQGYMQIFAGAMTGIRNPNAHDNLVIDQVRAIHLLYLASLLMSKLDEALKE